MKTVALEDIMISVLVTFLENTKELGCPRGKSTKEWFLNLELEEAQDIMNKILDIQERELAKMGVEED